MTAQPSVLDRFRLDGRTVVITGVGPGIGEHVARAFAAVGANVVCAARGTDRIEGLAADIRRRGGSAMAVTTDVARADDLHRLVERTHDAFGPVHVVFNNAATGAVAADQDPFGTADEVWDDAVAVNLLAPYRLARLVVPEMRSHGKGSIITLLTCGAFTPIAPQAAYGSTKAGLQMLTAYMAKSAGPGVRVNSICPGSISPDGIAHPAFAPHVAKNAIQRTGLADEVVGAALFLASDASSYTTGSTVFCEGGRVATIS